MENFWKLLDNINIIIVFLFGWFLGDVIIEGENIILFATCGLIEIFWIIGFIKYKKKK